MRAIKSASFELEKHRLFKLCLSFDLSRASRASQCDNVMLAVPLHHAATGKSQVASVCMGVTLAFLI